MRILNKTAYRNYQILESIEAGLVLLGSEVKALREGRVELGQSFARIVNGEVFLINAHIPIYKNSQIEGYDPGRSRKLLLHKNQIQSLLGKLSGGKTTLVPLALYESHNFIKVEIGLGRSKKEFDKRKVIKERDHIRRIEQELRGKE